MQLAAGEPQFREMLCSIAGTLPPEGMSLTAVMDPKKVDSTRTVHGANGEPAAESAKDTSF